MGHDTWRDSARLELIGDFTQNNILTRDDSCSIQYLLVLFYILTMNQSLSECAIAVLVNFDIKHVHNTDI